MFYVTYLINKKFSIYKSKNIKNIQKFIDDCKKNESRIDIKLIDQKPLRYTELTIKLEIAKRKLEIKNYIEFLKDYRRCINGGGKRKTKF